MRQCRNAINILVGFSLIGMTAACATNTGTAANEAPNAVAVSAQTVPAASAVQVAAAPTPMEAKATEIVSPAVKAEAVREPTVAVESRPTRTVAELAAQMHKDRRALYISSEGSYQYYIGGVLKAKYFPEEQRLVLLDMSTDQAQPCNYSIDGKLQTKAKVAADVAKSCAGLVEKLNNSLTN